MYTDRREHNRPFDKARSKGLILIASASSVLALLKVNRQINLEATPVFYKKTTFQLCDPVTLHMFIGQGPAYQLASLSELCINYKFTSHDEGKLYKETFITMLGMKKQKHLKIYVSDESWFSGPGGRRSKLGWLPGIQYLSIVLARVPDSCVDGKGGRIEKYLLAEVAKRREYLLSRHA